MADDLSARQKAGILEAERRWEEAMLSAERATGQQKEAARRAVDRAKDEFRRLTEAKSVADNRRRVQLQAAFKERSDRMAAQRKADEAKAAFNRQAQDKKAAGIKAAAKAEQGRAANAASIDRDRRALNETNYKEAQRLRTDEMRARHRGETDSLRQNGDTATERHWHGVKRIDAAEKEELAAFDKRCRSLTGRLTRMVQGKGEHERESRSIVAKYESARLREHRNLEARKERQAEVMQKARLHQAGERLSLRTMHRLEAKEREAGRDFQPVGHDIRGREFSKATGQAETPTLTPAQGRSRSRSDDD